MQEILQGCRDWIAVYCTSVLMFWVFYCISGLCKYNSLDLPNASHIESLEVCISHTAQPHINDNVHSPAILLGTSSLAT